MKETKGLHVTLIILELLKLVPRKFLHAKIICPHCKGQCSIQFDAIDALDVSRLLDDTGFSIDAGKEEILSWPIERLNLSVRSFHALQNGNVSSVRQLCSLTKGQLSRIKNLGRHSLGEIENELNRYGLRPWDNGE